jgi:hypothetical protein
MDTANNPVCIMVNPAASGKARRELFAWLTPQNGFQVGIGVTLR